MKQQFDTLLAQSLDPALEDEQRRIEAEGVNEGVAKYRKMLFEGNISDTGAGRQIFKETMGLVIPAIKKAQTEAVEGIANSAGLEYVLFGGGTSLFVSPEKLAYIALRSVSSSHGKGWVWTPSAEHMLEHRSGC